jgi:hypothetical protein
MLSPSSPRSLSLHDLAKPSLLRFAINHGVVVSDSITISLGELRFVAPRGSSTESPGLFLAEALREHPTLCGGAAKLVALGAGYGAAGLAAAEFAAVTLCGGTDDALSLLHANAAANAAWLAAPPHVALLAPGAAPEDAAAVARAFGPFDACLLDDIPSIAAAESLAGLALALLSAPAVDGGGGGGGGGGAPAREVRLLIAHRLAPDADGEDEALATLLVNLPAGAFFDAALLRKTSDAAYSVSPKRAPDRAQISTPKLGGGGAPAAEGGMPALALAGGDGDAPPPPPAAAAGAAGAALPLAQTPVPPVVAREHVRAEALPPVSEDFSNLVCNPALANEVVLVTVRFLL